ncbi:MAG: cyclase family protein [Gemmatimonadaceae bacterium]
MTLRCISITLRPETPEWPGDTPFSCTWAWRMAEGASVNVSCLRGSPHVGTHADAPLHVRDGAAPADLLPLASFMGPASVVDVSDRDGPIAETDPVWDRPIAGGRLLLRTGCSIADGAFPARWPTLSPAAVRRLLQGGLRLLAVDCPSVDERESKSLEVHHLVFDGGACIVENLDLRGVAPGDYYLVALPLKVAGADAAPVRAVLEPLGVA